jgi:hypothetical protein
MWLGLVMALAGGCFSLSFQNGSIQCSSDPKNLCPAGYSCIADHCWLTSQIDGGLSDGGSAD